MDYLAVFRPVFSYAAHISPEAGGDGDADAYRRRLTGDLRLLLALCRERRKRSDAEGFDAASDAVAAWLDDALSRRGFPGLFAEVEGAPVSSPVFFSTLDAVLGKDDNHRPADRRHLLTLFQACLEAGYSGGLPPDSGVPAEYRARCSRTLARLDRCDRGLRLDLATPACTEPGSGLFMRAVLWLMPPAGCVLLYFFYRQLLSGLCEGFL